MPNWLSGRILLIASLSNCVRTSVSALDAAITREKRHMSDATSRSRRRRGRLPGNNRKLTHTRDMLAMSIDPTIAQILRMKKARMIATTVWVTLVTRSIIANR